MCGDEASENQNVHIKDAYTGVTAVHSPTQSALRRTGHLFNRHNCAIIWHLHAKKVELQQ
jgi:hypothetical protein